ncbi:MAG: Gfo/Idh/MocA family protein [Thermoguttaceae bacterium]
MANKISRRTFTRTGMAAALGAQAFRTTRLEAARVLGANDRIRIGCIGVANRGGQLMSAFLEHDDCQIVALCDVFQPALEKANARLDGKADTCEDFRKLIDRDDLDAIVIATPDHWHAIQTIAACDAGKDVYVEKPLSVTIHEGRRMVEAARRNKRVVQVGTHRRSSALYEGLAQRTTAGQFGHIAVSRAYRVSNMFPNGIGRSKPQDPPPGLNWDLWLGPRPERPYQDNIAPYKFRWWHLYSSQMGNWGVHYLDAIRWCTGELAPASVCAMGGRFAVDDDRTVPDTLEACFEFASGRLAIFGQYEASGNPALPLGDAAKEIEFRGTQGTVYVYASGQGYEVEPERGGQFQSDPRTPRMKAEKVTAGGNNADLTTLHARNFLDCMRSRQNPKADVEIGHRSTSFSLMANISLAVGQRLDWDAEKEQFTNSQAANDLLHYEYRGPWKLG